MAVRIKWTGDKIAAQQRARLEDAVLRSAVLLHTRARMLCSKPARRVKGKGGARWIGSAPGSPPALRTGFGRSSILWEKIPGKDPAARVGIRGNGAYMVYLELGTKRIAKRPWLSRAVADVGPAIAVLLKAAARV